MGMPGTSSASGRAMGRQLLKTLPTKSSPIL
jgi:hypothetical protein